MFDSVKGMFGRAPKPVTPPRTTAVPGARIVNNFHAVSIKPGPRCCQTAKSMAGVRYLSREAPRLPLPQCDAAGCECKYVHHEDRRGYDRRMADGAPIKPGPTKSFEGADRRRARRDRRVPAETA